MASVDVCSCLVRPHNHCSPVAENFKKILGVTSIHKRVPFDFESGFVKHYFGKDKDCQLDYHEFCQLLQVLT